MNRIIKFGGTSLGSSQGLSQVIEIISDACNNEHKYMDKLNNKNDSSPYPGVVVSAFADTTDILVELAELAVKGGLNQISTKLETIKNYALETVLPFISEDIARQHAYDITSTLISELDKILFSISIVKQCTNQSFDLILSFGERLANRLIDLCLRSNNLPSISIDTRDIIITDDRFGFAQVDFEETIKRIDFAKRNWQNKLPIFTGFIGSTVDGRTTTLGRGGSDYTASILASILDVEELVIWTDVTGVMTADPTLIPDALPVTNLTYMEAVELAYFGARVLHPKTMIPVADKGIPIHIKNTFSPIDRGTLVGVDSYQVKNVAKSITSIENLTLVNIEWQRINISTDIEDRSLSAVLNKGISTWLFNQSGHRQNLCLVVPKSDRQAAIQAIHEEFKEEIELGELGTVQHNDDVSLLTLVGEGMGQTPGIGGRLFSAISSLGICVRAIAQGGSQRSISFVIDGEHTASAVRRIHDAFYLAHQRLNLVIVGVGTVGSVLIKQIICEQKRLLEEFELELNVVAMLNSKRVILNKGGVNLNTWEQDIINAQQYTDISDIFAELNDLENLVLVDMTAAKDIYTHYTSACQNGFHLVIANKIPISDSLENYDKIKQAVRQYKRSFLYETTVGAGLPVVETLKNFVATGDEVYHIEGLLSGTLGYICDQLMKGVKLSQAVKKAQENGFTEPMPADDLSGKDVVRKSIILARELGLRISETEVKLTPLVDENILNIPNLDEFYLALEKLDNDFTQKIQSIQKEDKVFRFLAKIDIHRGVEVSPTAVDHSHPAAQLHGADNILIFHTMRYQENPLVVIGPGAGADVTASGVLANIIQIAQKIRGNDSIN